MNRRALILVLCLAVAALGGLSAFLAHRLRAAEQELRVVTVTRVPTQHAASPSPDFKPVRAASAPTNASAAFDWTKVEAEDYRSYVANLRAIGCPEQTIRDIVIADVNKLYASRRADLTTGGAVPAYWRTTPELSDEEAHNRREQLLAWDKEKTDVIRSLLGVDPTTEARKTTEGYTYPENRLGNLPPETQDQASLIRERFNEQWEDVQARGRESGADADAISAQLRQLDADHLARLAEILTPQQLREHELQTSATALQLRSQLGGFQATEAEFQAIYDLQKAYDNEYVHYFGARTDPADLARQEAARQQLQRQIRDALGEPRYADYLRALAGPAGPPPANSNGP